MEHELPFLDKQGRPTADPDQAMIVTDEHGRMLRYRDGTPARRPNPMQYTDLKKAIEYTADHLRLQEQDLARPSGDLQKYNIKSKVMVLLTDGEPTVGGNRRDEYPDDTTVEKLTEAGIKVYFIQVLSSKRYRQRPDGTVEVVRQQRGLFGSMFPDREAELANQAIEEAKKLARRTGGEHFLATSGDQIREVYERIDELEKSDVGTRTVLTRKERYQPYLWAALAMLAAETLLGVTWFRRAP
jgi:Ca-activated chloride channel family protein